MHIKVTDFGTAKILGKNVDGETGWLAYVINLLSTMLQTVNFVFHIVDDRANSFVGTAEYVSPELLKEKAACKR